MLLKEEYNYLPVIFLGSTHLSNSSSIVNDGLIEIKELQIGGKKKINANDFINGMKEKTIKLI